MKRDQIKILLTVLKTNALNLTKAFSDNNLPMFQFFYVCQTSYFVLSIFNMGSIRIVTSSKHSYLTLFDLYEFHLNFPNTFITFIEQKGEVLYKDIENTLL